MSREILRTLTQRIGLHREEMIRFLSELVSIPTTNPPGESYASCARYISRRLSRWRIKHRLVQSRLESRGDSVMLIGGQAGSGPMFNLVPDAAHFTVDCRVGAHQSLEAWKRNIMKIIRDQRKKGWPVEMEILQEGKSSRTDPDTVLGRALARAILSGDQVD